MAELREGELIFDFSGCLNAEKFDEPGKKKPEGMSFVDFIVEENDRTLLIEVKDPCDTQAKRHDARREFDKKVRNGDLINGTLVPKCRDTYTYLHLMDRDHKDLIYIVLLETKILSR